MVYVIQRATCPIDHEIGNDIDLWRSLVPDIEKLEAAETIWKVWTTIEVLRAEDTRLSAYSQDKGWHSIELMTQIAPSYLRITHSTVYTIFTVISQTPQAIESLLSLLLNIYQDAAITNLMNFSKTHRELPVRSISVHHKQSGDNVYITSIEAVLLKELLLNRFREDEWDYLSLTFYSDIKGPFEISRLYICPQSGQARFVVAHEEALEKETEIERVDKLFKLADIIFDEFAGTMAALDSEANAFA
ncbi:MAG TPA: hypothetical protein VKV20_12765 [Ktedonobacteraceae bacterium]|jgi:hypothetical protein|nr:hypothetical protein [Ktedonobacteraceae bacterium]